VISEKGLTVPISPDQKIIESSPTEAAPKMEMTAPGGNRFVVACGIAILAAAGGLGLFRELGLLWSIWTLDPLRSIGMLIPPISIWLTLRVWRQLGWRLSGSWWGVGFIALAYLLNLLQQRGSILAVFGNASFSLLPVSLPLYLYAGGIVLLFAGTEVWRKAWFPLGLLLLAQPVPLLSNALIDIPLQNISARVARSFATLIHFAPSTPQLRLMFSPDFGMFIAPGCDGIRGAVTMGYVALILGYLRRVTWYLWIAYVAGAVLLGYLFNFIRLCVLVIYYRIALGHPALENVAKQADYVIGSCLFLTATFLFFWLASRRQVSLPSERKTPATAIPVLDARGVVFRCSAFVAILVVFLVLSPAAFKSSHAGVFVPEQSAARMPKQIGSFSLTRTWYEQESGVPVVQAGAYSSPGSDEIILAVWIASLNYIHSSKDCWLARGLEPELVTQQSFLVAGERALQLDTSFFSDGVTDSIVVNTTCTPETCSQFQNSALKHFGIVYLAPLMDTFARKEHPVSIMVRIDRIHSAGPRAATHQLLLTEAQSFLASFDPTRVSGAFQ
jgi:exosortase J